MQTPHREDPGDLAGESNPGPPSCQTPEGCRTICRHTVGRTAVNQSWKLCFSSLLLAKSLTHASNSTNL
ncbi:hypothetical protein AOLI_G00175190 [Acnodon oligacanthus]